jgi:hypothetical protein
LGCCNCAALANERIAAQEKTGKPVFTQGIEKQGFDRIQYGTVQAPMPPMGFSIKTSDDLWKIIAFIRSINPPGTNPPEKMVPGRMHTE